jgi:hypothetical protein
MLTSTIIYAAELPSHKLMGVSTRLIIWFLPRPWLDAARVRENWFLVSQVMARWCQRGTGQSRGTFCRFLAGFGAGRGRWRVVGR